MPEELHLKKKERAAKAGMSLSQYLLMELRKSAEVPTMEEMRERLRNLPPIETSESPVDIIRARRGPI
jgi:hypothetical protein